MMTSTSLLSETVRYNPMNRSPRDRYTPHESQIQTSSILTFSNLEDYHDFRNHYDLKYEEIIVKPIFDHRIGLLLRGNDQIVYSGRVFSREISITYTPHNISITYYSLSIHKKEVVVVQDQQQNLTFGDHLTWIIHFEIPELSKYVWDLLHDQIPPLNSQVDLFTKYFRVLYLKTDGCLGCEQELVDRINNFHSENNVRIFAPDKGQQLIVMFIMSWKIHLYRRRFQKCLDEILYRPFSSPEWVKSLTVV
jgi:hypothetical protein